MSTDEKFIAYVLASGTARLLEREMTRALFSVFVLLMAVSGPVMAQKSSAAEKQAESWIDQDLIPDRFVKRATFSRGDIDAWEAATMKAGVEASRSNLFLTLPRFRPLFDTKDQLVVGAVAKYAKRLEQIPAKVTKEWETLSGLSQVRAAISLSAENGLFPGEKYSEAGFRALTVKFK